MLTSEEDHLAATCLERKVHSLVQIGILIGLDAAPQSYAAYVDSARLAGARPEEIVGTLVAAILVLGVPGVVAAAGNLGLALCYDIDAELENGCPTG